MATNEFDTRSFRNALGAFLTGVTIVTTRDADGTPRGFTANSFTSVSLDPPLVLVCLAKSASSYPVFQSCDRFAVSVLSEEQEEISGTFASKVADRFGRVQWHSGLLDCPLISGAVSHFECRTHQKVDAGDHLVLIGRVINFTNSNTVPLGYCRGTYINLSLSQAAINFGEHRSCLGAIIERDGAVLFIRDTKHGLRLPVGHSLGPASDRGSLAAALEKIGVSTRLEFLFSVYEDGDAQYIFYRGTADGRTGNEPDAHWITLDEIPWDELGNENERKMLRRYVRERQQDTFGIYSGTTMTVEPLVKKATASS